MSGFEIARDRGIAIVRLDRGKVNALNHPLVRDLASLFDELADDEQTRGVVLTGSGKFFSFGFDIPEFLGFTKEQFTRFLVDFTDLYTRMFLLPKPLVAGLNGHAVAGACMMALACDRRVMATGKAKISLNEISFGASVFAGCVEMLRAVVGHRTAETVLYGGRMYVAERALELGLVDRIAPPDEVGALALEEALELAGQDGVAFRSIKGLLRRPIAEVMRRHEPDSIREFADIWYSESTWRRLHRIEIRS